MSRPDYIACLQKPKSAMGYCGEEFGFFQSAEHVRLNRAQDGRLVCCPVCLAIAGEPELAKGEMADLLAEVVRLEAVEAEYDAYCDTMRASLR